MRDAERRTLLPRGLRLRGSFAPSVKKKVFGAAIVWTTCDTNHILHDYPCVHALQETDKWTTSAMNVPGNIVYGSDHGKTAILCPREFFSVAHGVTMRGAPPLWWGQRCFFQ